MPLIIVCPSGHRLKVPKKLAGYRIVCPVCNQRFSVPPLPAPQKQARLPSAPTVDHLPNLADQAVPKVSLRRPVESIEEEQNAPPHAGKIAPAETRRSDNDFFAAFDHQVVAGPDVPCSESIINNGQHDEVIANSVFEVSAGKCPHLDRPSVPFIREELPSIVGQQPRQQSVDPNFKREQQLGNSVLGIAAIVVAAFCSAPSIIDQVATRRTGLQPADTWTYIVLLAATIQAAVAIYAIRLPDWSTSWIASLMTTGFAAMYALGLALTMFANQEHQLVKQLGLLDEAYHWRAQLWCFLVMCVTLILAYCYGRFSLRWYKLEKQLIESRA